MDMTFAREKGFKMERMKNPLLVKNVDGTVNAGGAITHQVECNMFFKGHVERVRMDVCNLGKTEVILGMPWLAAHNPEIDWEKVFGKRESERMPVQKAWDHTIELKEGFTPKKGKVYSLSREEREEVQAFVEDQLRKGYI